MTEQTTNAEWASAPRGLKEVLHTDIHTDIHAYIHTEIHAYIHTHIHSYVHTHRGLPLWAPLSIHDELRMAASFTFVTQQKCRVPIIPEQSESELLT